MAKSLWRSPVQFGFRHSIINHQSSFGFAFIILFALIGAAIRLAPSTLVHHANRRHAILKTESPGFPPNRRPGTGRARTREPGRPRRRTAGGLLRAGVEAP